MYQIQFNKSVIKNHFQYEAWKYIVGIIVAIMMWSILTIFLAPKTPDEQRVDIYLAGSYAHESEAVKIADAIREDLPELMEINFYNIILGRLGDTIFDLAGSQRLAVILGSRSGELFMLEEKRFLPLAEQGVFIPLNDLVNEIEGLFTTQELEKFTLTVEVDGKEVQHIYGLSMANINSLESTGYDVTDSIAGVMAYGKNKEKALEVLKWLIINGQNTDK